MLPGPICAAWATAGVAVLGIAATIALPNSNLASIAIALFSSPFFLLAWRAYRAQLNPEKIDVLLARSQEYSYEGATHDEQFKILKPNYPIQNVRANQKTGFIFGVANKNRGIPLKTVGFNVVFNRLDKLEVMLDSDGKTIGEGKWLKQFENERYWLEWTTVLRDRHSWDTIWVKFPSPKSYYVTFEIDCEGLEEIIKKNVEVRVN